MPAIIGIIANLTPLVVVLLAGWCRNVPLSDVGGEGRTKANVAKRIYNGCAQVAEWKLRKMVGDFKLGGPDVVVIVDVFPGGNMSLEAPMTSHNNNFSKRVLCIADTAHVPVRVWASLLDGSNKVKLILFIFFSNVFINVSICFRRIIRL